MKALVINERITTRESEAFLRYLKDVATIEVFETPEDEYECAVRAYNGDEAAKEELIRRNLRFVISCAKQFLVNGVSLEDLVNEGNIGITTAADRFNPEKGHKFISYAVWYIRKEIQSFLNSHSRTIRIPNNRVDGVFKYKRLMSELEQELQRTVEPSDMLAKYPSLYTEDEIKILDELTRSETHSLDMSVGDDDGATLVQLMPDDSMGKADDLVNQKDVVMNVDEMLSTLKDDDREIITKLFGLDGEAPRTLADVGHMYDISRESVRQRRDKAFKQLKGKFYRGNKQFLID